MSESVWDRERIVVGGEGLVLGEERILVPRKE